MALWQLAPESTAARSLPCTQFVETLQRMFATQQDLSLTSICNALSNMGHTATIRTGRRRSDGGTGGESVFRALRHSFVFLRALVDGRAEEYIVDPSFREQFVVLHATPEYAALVCQVPEVLVSSPDRLRRVVEGLCAEMAGSFAEMNIAFPPWRKASSMISKWLPKTHDDHVPQELHPGGARVAAREDVDGGEADRPTGHGKEPPPQQPTPPSSSPESEGEEFGMLMDMDDGTEPLTRAESRGIERIVAAKPTRENSEKALRQ